MRRWLRRLFRCAPVITRIRVYYRENGAKEKILGEYDNTDVADFEVEQFTSSRVFEVGTVLSYSIRYKAVRR